MTIKDELRMAVRKWMIGSVELKQLLEDDDPKFDKAYDAGEISHEMFEELVDEVRSLFARDRAERMNNRERNREHYRAEDYEAGL